MKERFVIDGQVLIVHYAELLRQYQCPPIEGVVWYYPNVNVLIVDECHFIKPPSFVGYDIGKTVQPFDVPTKTAKRIPRQPKPRPRDQYLNRRRF